MAAQHDDPTHRFCLSSDDLSEADRLAIWREVYGEKLFNLDLEAVGDAPFRARLDICKVGPASVSVGQCSASTSRITRRHLPQAQQVVMCIMLASGHAATRQNGREVEIAAGEAIALSSTALTEMTLSDDSQYIGVYLPHDMLRAILPKLDDHLARRIPQSIAGLDLLTGYARLVHATGDASLSVGRAGDYRPRLADHLCDLAALALSNATLDATGSRAADQMRSGGLRAARLAAIRRFIQQHLADRELSVDAVAAHLKISPSYVRKLLERDDTNFADLVLELRLARAYRHLSDPLCLDRQISVIAYGTGFGDLSYFNRCFRRRYGMTPTEARQRNLQPTR